MKGQGEQMHPGDSYYAPDRDAVIGTFAAGDGLSIRYGIWPAPTDHRIGSVLLLNGRKEFLEKYAETIADLTNRGYDVYSIDWRGQGLSDRLLADRLKGHIESYTDYLQDLKLFIDRFVRTIARRPLIVLAHSMGAHIALRYLHDEPAVADRAVLTSPMIDIRTAPYPRQMTTILARTAVTVGLADNMVPGASGRSALTRKFDANPLTSDPRRFKIESDAIRDNPALALGGPTFGWLAATLRSIDLIQSDGFLEKISVPLLMIGAGRDKVVSRTAQRLACSRLPNCRFSLLEDALHEVLMESDRIRNGFWDAFDRFAAAGR